MPKKRNQRSTRQDDKLPWQTVWRLRISTIIWFLLALGFLLALPVLFDATVLLVIAAAVIAVLTGALIAWVYHRFFSREKPGGFTSTWVKSSLASLFILCIAVAAPMYYFAIKTATNPALLPRVTLSDGNKTVVFQGMMHIGTESFYKSVVYDAEKALSEGYVLYYEGVQPNPAADKWFSDNLAGGGDLSKNYEALGEICGLKFQLDYFDLLEKDFDKHPDSHVKADVDTLAMKQEYERLLRSDPEFSAAMKSSPAKAKADAAKGMASAIDWLKQGTEGQRKLAGIFCRWSLNKVGAKEDAKDRDQMKKVIRDFRDRKLAERILADDNNKIYITYGAAHIPGVIRILKQADPAWTVKSTTWNTPIEAPRNLEGEL